MAENEGCGDIGQMSVDVIRPFIRVEAVLISLFIGPGTNHQCHESRFCSLPSYYPNFPLWRGDWDFQRPAKTGTTQYDSLPSLWRTVLENQNFQFKEDQGFVRSLRVSRVMKSTGILTPDDSLRR